MKTLSLALYLIVGLSTGVHGVDVMDLVKRRLAGLSDGSSLDLGEPMQVIGAGFGRTGTESLCAALTELGYKTYHGTKAIRYAHLPQWNAFFDQEDDKVFSSLEAEGFNATTDFPASLAYKTFLERNPASKVVLSLHPGGSKGWAKSYNKVGRSHGVLMCTGSSPLLSRRRYRRSILTNVLLARRACWPLPRRWYPSAASLSGPRFCTCECSGSTAS